MRLAQLLAYLQRMHELHRQHSHITGRKPVLGVKRPAVRSWHEFRHEGKFILRGQQCDEARNVRVPHLHERGRYLLESFTVQRTHGFVILQKGFDQYFSSRRCFHSAIDFGGGPCGEDLFRLKLVNVHL